MKQMPTYTNLGWRETIVLGTALEKGILKATADGEPRTPVGVARDLRLDERAVRALLSALQELEIVLGEDCRFEVREPLAPGGRLVIRGFVRGLSEEAALFAVNMLLLTPDGGTYPTSDYKLWLSVAGFRGPEIIPVPGRGTHPIMARNPE